MALALTVAVAPAYAQQNLSLEVTVPAVNVPSELFRPNRDAADFLGVGLVQTVYDIRKILISQNFSHEDSSGNFLLDEEYSNVDIIATGPNRYFTYVIWSAPDDASATQSVRVEFSSPLTGQRSTDVRRFVNYREGAEPLLATLRSAIFQKYGPPSIDNSGQMVWFWDHGELVKNDPHDKQMVIALGVAGDYVRAVTYGLIDVAAVDADRGQVAKFQKSVEDAAKQVRDNHAATPNL